MNVERKKIIAVDDNLDNLNGLKNTLKDLYTIYPCPSAQEMFELLEHIQPDLIFLDVEMPGMNGYEAAKKLKYGSKYNQIPIMFLTSKDDTLSEMEGLVIGAVDYIHKPIVAPLLLQRIKMHFDMTENQRKALIVAHDKEEILERMRNEIRSPLNDAIDAINLAVKENDIQTIKNHLEKALGSSKNALGVVNSILDAPKAEADKTGL